MAWQAYQFVGGAVKAAPFRQLSRPHQQCTRCFRFLTPRNCQRRAFSQSSLRPAAPLVASAGIDGSPARVLPTSPAYFTGIPNFTDQLLQLEYFEKKYSNLPTVPSNEAPRMSWLRLGEFRERIGESVATTKYRRVLALLNRLNHIDRRLAPQEVVTAMESFVREGNPQQEKAAPPTIDDMGRARGVGRRKTSSAQAWLVEGDGQVLINGRNIIELFPRIHDRESALWALRSTGRVDKYNVFVMVRGGGLTGQAEATTVAVARALLVHEPALKPALRKGMLRLGNQVFVSSHYHLLEVPRCSLIPSAVLQSIVPPANFSPPQLLSWYRHDGFSTGRKEEAWSSQGTEDAYLEEEMSLEPILPLHGSQSWDFLCLPYLSRRVHYDGFLMLLLVSTGTAASAIAGIRIFQALIDEILRSRPSQLLSSTCV